MAEYDGQFWLPSDFLSDDFFLDGGEHTESRRATSPSGLTSESGSSSGSLAETESDEEDQLAALTTQMSHAFLKEEVLHDGDKLKVAAMAGSPQSTLCDFSSIWSDSNKGSPSGPSSPPPEQHAGDVLEPLSAAEQLDGLGLGLHHGCGLLVAPATHGGLYSPPLLAEQQLQAVRLYHLKQKQLMKQQCTAAWGRQQQNRNGKGCGGGRRTLGLPSSAWPPLQQQLPPSRRQQQQPQPGSGMRAVFLAGNGTRKATGGTGVFLPRRPGSPTEARRKAGCSTVLLPDRVIQALNLNLDEVCGHARLPGGFLLDHDALVAARSNTTMTQQKRRHHRPPPATAATGHEHLLPAEWTY